MSRKRHGRHLLVDCWDVGREICLDDKKLLSVMVEAVQAAGEEVKSQVRYKFGHNSPPGFACAVILENSHCSAHSYADLGLIAMDVFTSGRTNPRTIMKGIRERVDLGRMTVREFKRFPAKALKAKPE